ncbi:MAG: MFS transporter [Chloroflexi bacterium]|nr:MFS transporter [Chloroflexota bacterium]
MSASSGDSRDGSIPPQEPAGVQPTDPDAGGPGIGRAPRTGLTGRIPALGAFSYPPFRHLWAGGVLLAVGVWGERVVVGWFVLDQTGSVFWAATTFAVRSLPFMLLAPIAGAVADRVDRRRLLLATALLKGVVIVAMGLLALGEAPPIWALLALVSMAGVGSAFEMPSTQALITDLVPRRDAMNAVSLYSTGMRVVGVLGGLAGGVMTDAFSPSAALFASAGAVVLGGIVIQTVRKPAVARGDGRPGARAVWSEAVEGLRLMSRTQVVAALLILAVFVEIFGFSHGALLPAVAKNVLGVGATGLGALTLMAGVGSVAGAGALAAMGDYRRKGLLILVATLGYGVALIVFSRSSVFAVSLVLIAGVGMAAAMFDAMQWVLLQANVPDRFRGRAIGGWVFAIGFGWIGHLLLGAVAEQIGVQWTLTASGSAVLAAGIVAIAVSPRLRGA